MAQDDTDRDLHARLEAVRQEIGEENLAALLRLPPEVRALLLDLPPSRPPKQRLANRGKVGRRRGSGADAEPALARMEALLLVDVELSEREAAERVSREGIVHLSAVRLRTLYRQRRAGRLIELRREATEARQAAQASIEAATTVARYTRAETEAVLRTVAEFIERATGRPARELPKILEQQRAEAARQIEELRRAMWAPGGVLYHAALLLSTSGQTPFGSEATMKYLREMVEQGQRRRTLLPPGSETPENS